MGQTTPCPGLDRLRALLDDTILEDEAGLLAHIEDCAECRGRLDRIAFGTSPPDGLPPESPATRGHPSTTLGRLLDALKARSRSVEARPGRPASAGRPTTTEADDHGDDDLALDFLEPPERPGDLGRLGPYRIAEVIGRGGMGIVLRGLDEKLHRAVAIKVLDPALAGSGTARRRFAREAQAAAAVCHEHVVTIHAVDQAAGLPYLVMQFIAGLSLQEKIDRDGPLPMEEVLRIGMQAASGLAAAHAQGLVHRDVKPANILLENGVERVKITDFGLARAVDDASLTKSGVVAGTPEYMSPEQARGEVIDARSDLFSLGSVLYALCTGRPPFRASSSLAALKRVCEEEPRPILEFRPEVPEPVVRIIGRLLAKDPAGRIATADEAARLLTEQLARLQHAGPPRPARPRRWILTTVLVASLLLLAAVLAALAPRRSRRPRLGADPPVVANPPVNPPAPAPTAREGADDWPPGDDDPRFPGLVPRPASLAGAVRWQVASRYPRAPLSGVAWSPDGGRIAICGEDEAVRVFEVEGRRLILAWPVPKAQALDWSADGRRIVTTGKDGAVRLWDAEDGAAGPVLALPSLWLPSVAFSPDGRRVAVAMSWSHEVRVWSAASNGSDLSLRHPDFVTDAAWHPGGKALASACKDGTIRLWDAASGEMTRSFKAHAGAVSSLAFHPDGRRLVSTGVDRRVRVWDLERAEEGRSWDGGGTAVAVAVDAAGEGWVAACYEFDESVRLRRLETGEPGPQCWGHSWGLEGPRSIRFRPDGRVLATVGRNARLSTWDPATGENLRVIERHGGEVSTVACDGTGETFATVAYYSDAARLWKTSDGTLRRLLRAPPGYSTLCVALLPGGREVATGADDGSVRLWHVDSGKDAVVLLRDPSPIRALAFSPDGGRLAFLVDQNSVRLRDRAEGTPTRTLRGGKTTLMSIAFSPDGRRLAASGMWNEFFFWDAATAEPRPGPAVDWVYSMAYAPDGRTIATGELQEVRIRDADAGGVVGELPAEGDTNWSVAFSGDGALLAAGNRFGVISLWDTRTRTLKRTLRAGAAECRSLAFADARVLASGSADGVARLWDASTGVLLSVVVPFLGDRAVTISPGGKVVASVPEAEDEIVYLVRPSEKGGIENLTPAAFRDRFGGHPARAPQGR